MNTQEAQNTYSLYADLLEPNENPILFIVIDGLGGIPHVDYDYKTALEYAQTPVMDSLAQESACGLHLPVAPGITPGSSPAHLAIFGYDPCMYDIGRGAVEAAGLGYDLGPDDVATRCNWCIQDDWVVTDRRAGRISTHDAKPLIEKLQKGVKIDGVKITVLQGVDHRFVTIFSADGLGASVNDTDPLVEGRKIIQPQGSDSPSRKTASIVMEFMKQGFDVLKHEKANGFNLRGFAKKPEIPDFNERNGVKAAAYATHPLYKGVGKLVGMDVVDVDGTSPSVIMKALKKNWNKYSFHYLHFKYPDSKGEDGDFEGKVKALEEIDGELQLVQELNPHTLLITGDHCTPAAIGGHGWHFVPYLIKGPFSFRDDVKLFSEKECVSHGYYGRQVGISLMPELLAQSGRLRKYGA